MNQPIPPSPYLKFAGRKFNHPAPLSELFAPYRKTHVWCEPFCGANGATFKVLPEVAMLNDRNPYTIALHQWVKDTAIPSDTSFLVNEEGQYYLNRKWFNQLASLYPTYEAMMGAHASEREAIALLYYYLNRTGYNGVMRFNQKGRFNVPFGHNSGNYERDFTHYQKFMKGWSFYCSDWDDFLGYVVDFLGERPFIYIDPPYDGDKGAFVGYCGGGFGWEDQVKLCDRLSGLSFPVVASNLATERIVDLYQGAGFMVWTFHVRRSVSCKGEGRSTVREILAIKGVNFPTHKGMGLSN